jgi:hypothetical protein
MTNGVHRILDHGWVPNGRVRIDVAVEHNGEVCRVRRTGIYRYHGFLSWFDVNLEGKRVKLGGDETDVPFHVKRMPRGAKCGGR